MRFDKGNKYGDLRKLRLGGRPKSLSTVMKQVLKEDYQKLPDYFAALSEKALNGDREAAMYLIDRHLGKPKGADELTIKGGEAIGAGVVVKLFEVMDARAKEIEEARVKRLT